MAAMTDQPLFEERELDELADTQRRYDAAIKAAELRALAVTGRGCRMVDLSETPLFAGSRQVGMFGEER